MDPWNRKQNLASKEVRGFVREGFITMEQARELSNGQRLNLMSPSIRQLIANKIISFQQALDLNHNQRDNLRSENVCQLIIDEIITLDQALNLDKNQENSLCHESVCKLIVDEIITLDQLSTVNFFQQPRLALNGVCELIANGIIPFEQALTLREDTCRALDDPDTLARIINGDLNIQHFIEGNILRAGTINHNQSTHTASVHQTVSESAKKLGCRYSHKIRKKSRVEKIIKKSGLENIMRKTGIVSDSNLDDTIREINEFVQALPDNNPNNQVAKRCIKNITAIDFIDPASQLSIKELLALSFSATRDSAYHQNEIEEAENRFIEGLVEIQRGYNLSKDGFDSDPNLPDIPICASGSFNKLIEKLQGVHPDCEVQYLTEETASLKLPIIVREELANYLSNLIVSEQKEKSLLRLENKIQKVKQSQETEVFLPKIKRKVTDRLFDEFASLYGSSKLNDRFLKLVNSSQYVDVSAVLDKSLANVKERLQFLSAAQQQFSLMIDGAQPMLSREASHRYNWAANTENESLFLPSPENGAIPRHRYGVDSSLLLVSTMESLSLIPDESTLASYSGDMVASNFWQPSFTSSEDNGAFETHDLCNEHSGARSKNVRRRER